jgi:glycerol-3-phosphate cytidylyltransferase
LITVYTTGVFDLLHFGHLRLLQRAAQLGDRLVVGVSTDELVLSYKKQYPTVPFEERMALVAELKSVDQVVAQSERSKVKAWETLKFDVWTHGSDWKDDPFFQQTERELSSRGVRCIYLPYSQGVSSTLRRKALSERRE